MTFILIIINKDIIFVANLNQQEITSSIKIYIANTNQYIDY